MTALQKTNLLPSMSDESIKQAREMESFLLTLPQELLTTDHSIHSGIYTRTIFIPKDVIISGALVKCNTTLVISGHVIVFIGEDTAKEIIGYSIITASANRKQVFIAKEDTYLTMIFATNSDNINDAEEEFTDEVDLLMSRQSMAINNITITGE